MPDKIINLTDLGIFKEEMDASVNEKVSAKQDKLPATTSADEGKVLMVDENGSLGFDELQAGLDASQFFEAFDATKTYAIGDAVSYDGKFYLCKTAISTAGDWDSTKWVETKPVMQVINLGSLSSGGYKTLTEEELALALSNCCIFHNDQYYMHKYSSNASYPSYITAAAVNSPYDQTVYFFHVFINKSNRRATYERFSVAGVYFNYAGTASYKRRATNILSSQTVYDFSAADVQYTTTAPTADNTSGRLEVVFLSAEPVTKYAGYIYIIGNQYSVVKESPDANNLAPAYSDSSTYVIDDLVTYNNQLYQCTTAIPTAEAWDPTHWTATSLADSVLGLINTAL